VGGRELTYRSNFEAMVEDFDADMFIQSAGYAMNYMIMKAMEQQEE